MTDKANKPSPVEGHKIEGRYLRGTIAEEMRAGADHFETADVNLLKHHGTYQQDDRDARAAARGEGGKPGKAYMFMVRTKIPGGRLTSDQLLAELDLCEEVANGTLRLTSRQGLQLHGVLLGDLKRTIKRINDVQLSTLGACGDVNRNVMCCPAPYRGDPVHQQMQDFTDRLAAHLAPRSPAYHDIWLRDLSTGQEEQVAGEAVEPIYGAAYLPRKFKIAVGLPGDNCVDMYTHDLAFMAICENWQVVGYNVLAGGGQGKTPSAAKTFPAMAKKLVFVTPEQALDLATAVVLVQRDFGNRSDRKLARMKYLIADWGLEKFRAKVEEYYGEKLADPVAEDVWGFDDHLGWAEQGDGRWFYGLNIENGRIKDEGTLRLKAAIREICSSLQPGIRLTSHQSLLFTDLDPLHKGDVEHILKSHGVPLSREISQARRWSMACVAWPTCGLSITEAERALPGIIDQVEAELARQGLSAERFTIRMTGCPNGCARPYNSDIGLVGRAAGKYTIYVGGRLLGDRLNFVYKDMVPEAEVVAELAPLFTFFKSDRQPNETFGDFCHRQGLDALTAWVDGYRASQNGAGAAAENAAESESRDPVAGRRSTHRSG